MTGNNLSFFKNKINSSKKIANNVGKSGMEQNNHKKTIVAIILFGSIWGFFECVIGSVLNNANLPSGMIMTSVFAISFLLITRFYYKRPGMQLGMGLVAGTLRLFNPFVGCHLCSALAIIAEGALFESIWFFISYDLNELKSLRTQLSLGVFSTYIIFIGGYIITQITTPIVAGTGFYIDNLIVFMPRILASGLLPALIGGLVLPVNLKLRRLNLTVKDKLFYPISLGIAMVCWIFVVGIWFIGV